MIAAIRKHLAKALHILDIAYFRSNAPKNQKLVSYVDSKLLVETLIGTGDGS